MVRTNEFLLFKQKTAYEMRISDGSADVCSSDLWDAALAASEPVVSLPAPPVDSMIYTSGTTGRPKGVRRASAKGEQQARLAAMRERLYGLRSEEHTSELQSLMRISYAVFCLKKKKTDHTNNKSHQPQPK